MTIQYPPQTPAYKLSFDNGRVCMWWFVFDATLPGFRHLSDDHPPIKARRMIEESTRVENVIPVAEALKRLDPDIDTGER